MVTPVVLEITQVTNSISGSVVPLAMFMEYASKIAFVGIPGRSSDVKQTYEESSRSCSYEEFEISLTKFDIF